MRPDRTRRVLVMVVLVALPLSAASCATRDPCLDLPRESQEVMAQAGPLLDRGRMVEYDLDDATECELQRDGSYRREVPDPD